MYWIQVRGPSTTGGFGYDDYRVVNLTDIKESDTGCLVIVTAPRDESTTPHGFVIKACGPRTIVYPKHGWTKVKIGEVGG